MNLSSCAFKIDSTVREEMRNYCKSHGLKQGYFVETAIREKMERESMREDAMEFGRLNQEENQAIDFSSYLSQRGE